MLVIVFKLPKSVTVGYHQIQNKVMLVIVFKLGINLINLFEEKNIYLAFLYLHSKGDSISYDIVLCHTGPIIRMYLFSTVVSALTSTTSISRPVGLIISNLGPVTFCALLFAPNP